jgi:hypothetical protein
MKAKQMKALESYFKTKNDHWNGFTLEMLCEILKQGEFENPEVPLELFSNAIDLFDKKHETPLQAVQQFARELDKKKLSASQKLFLYHWVWKYLDETEFENLDLTTVKDLLEIQEEKLKAEIKFDRPQEKNIREMLKDIVKNEFEQLSETLKGLEPVQRLNVICKLAPFVLPKMEAIDSND